MRSNGGLQSNKILRLFRWVFTNWRKVTLGKVGNFIAAYYRKIYYKIFLDKFIEDQVHFRRNEVLTKSPECLNNGACIHCGCDMPDKLYESDACEAGCYPEWKTVEEWVEFVKKSNANKADEGNKGNKGGNND